MDARPRQRTDDSTPAPADVGRAIRNLRRQRHLQQGELAAAIGMQSAPLCNIENGKNHPSLRTLYRIAEALGVTVNDLLYPPEYVQTARVAESGGGAQGSANAYERFEARGIARATRTAGETEALTPAAREAIQTRVLDYLALEDLCGACKRAAIPLQVPFSVDEAGAAQLAYTVRTHCGIGSAVVFDYVELLENQGLRVLFLKLPQGIESLSFYDAANANAFIVLGEGYNPEKQLFRMAYELANIYLFTANRHAPVDETPATRRFAKEFAAVFLMPQEAVRATVMQLGVKPSEWTYELLLRIKHRFGVSAEAFAHRLEEVGAMEKSVRQRLKERIQEHYAAHAFAEPDESRRVLSRNGRFGDLLLCARRFAASTAEADAIAARAGVARQKGSGR